MKKLSHTLGIALVALLLPLLSHAAGYVTEQTPTFVAGQKYTANYKVTTAPNSTVQVYSRFAEYGTTNWNYNVAGAPLISINSGSLNASFSADFSFGALGVVAGKKYIYYLASDSTANAPLLTNPACFDVTGQISCTAVPAQVLDSSSFVVAQVSQGLDAAHPGKYLINASIAPSVAITAPVAVTLKIVDDANSQNVAINSVNSASVKIVGAGSAVLSLNSAAAQSSLLNA